MHAGLVFRVGRRAAEACLALLGSPAQVAAEDRKLALERGKAAPAPHTAAPFSVHGAQSPAAIKSDKDGGFFPFGQSALYCIEEGTKKAIDL